MKICLTTAVFSPEKNTDWFSVSVEIKSKSPEIISSMNAFLFSIFPLECP